MVVRCSFLRSNLGRGEFLSNGQRLPSPRWQRLTAYDIRCLNFSVFTPGDRLDSWKEIAAYLRRSVRTVTRWEREGLPVHRHLHSKTGTVYAYKSELDAWWNTRGSNLDAVSSSTPSNAQSRPRFAFVATFIVAALV